jgi:hypothetical protein
LQVVLVGKQPTELAEEAWQCPQHGLHYWSSWRRKEQRLQQGYMYIYVCVQRASD